MAQKYPPLIMNPELVFDLRAVQRETVQGEDARQTLGRLLQSALQLEYSTVNPYLSAAFSLTEDNEEIRDLIFRIAQEEMLHMTVVANLMNAIGVSPDIVKAVPDYPFDLEVLDPPLKLELSSFSFDLVESLFLRVETPEDPVEFPVGEVDFSVLAIDRPETVGQFYKDIIEVIQKDTIPNLFQNAERDLYKQIEVKPNFSGEVRYANDQDTGSYPISEEIDFVIKDKETAVRYLNWIVSGGEGASPINPISEESLPGHYYRFESILKGKYLIKNEAAELGFSYSGGTLPFSQDGVYEFDDNAKVESYSDYERVERHMNRFNSEYTNMIDFLQTAFNCPNQDDQGQSITAYQDSIEIMRRMGNLATAIVRAAKREEIKAGIPFQYLSSE